MPPRHYNKLRGLKKLREITKHTPGRATYAQFKVYERPEQFRIGHAQGMPRLLVRSDEKGKTYNRLRWASMPRLDLNIEAKPSRARLTERLRARRAQGKAQREMGRRYHGTVDSEKKLESYPFSKYARFIVHPTRRKEDMFCDGKVCIFRIDDNNFAQISMDFPANSTNSHLAGRWSERNFTCQWEGGKFLSAYGSIIYAQAINRFPQLIGNLEAFLKAGIETGQLQFRPRGRDIVMRFVTWKDKPEVPEFYDLLELGGKTRKRKRKR